MKNPVCTLDNSGNEDTRSLLQVIFLERLFNIFANVSIKVPKETTTGDDYSLEVLNQYVDFKKIINGDSSSPQSFLIAIVVRNIFKGSNVEMKFPLDKGFYQFKDIVIPGSLIMSKAKFSFSGKLMAKTNKRKLIFAVDFQFYGRLNL
jgi:hypothetical protein